jgi:DNA-binding NtrC family response regulator
MGEFAVGSKKNILPSIAELKSNKVIPIESAFRSSKPSVLSQSEDQRKKLIVDALNLNNWKQSVTARYLGISANTLRYYLRKYGLTKPTTKWWEKISTRKSLLR